MCGGRFRLRRVAHGLASSRILRDDRSVFVLTFGRKRTRFPASVALYRYDTPATDRSPISRYRQKDDARTDMESAKASVKTQCFHGMSIALSERRNWRDSFAQGVGHAGSDWSEYP